MEKHLELTLLCFVLFAFCYADAWAPSCEGGREMCQCLPPYKNYEVSQKNNRSLNCIKAFPTKLDWNATFKTCEREHSFILQENIDEDLYGDFKIHGDVLIWMGIRRIAESYEYVGLYSGLYSTLFRNFSNRRLGLKWSFDEPVHDCVALNFSSKLLVTRECSSELNFFCQNSGFPIYPINKGNLSTYILSIHGNTHKLKDFSRLSSDLSQFMRNVINNLKMCFFKGISWNFLSFSSNRRFSTIVVLLYVWRNRTELGAEVKVYQQLQKQVTRRKFMSPMWSKTSLELHSADVCFLEVVPRSLTSFPGDVTWHTSLITNTAVSEPMCLNEWKLVTRECKPSAVVGAKWQPFNYTLCKKYQTSVQDQETNCPNGFLHVKPNLCYSVHEGASYDEASEICQNSSSYLMNAKILAEYIFFASAQPQFSRDPPGGETSETCPGYLRNSKRQMKNMFSAMDMPATFWISGKLEYLNVYFTGNRVLLNLLKLPNMSRSKSRFYCVSVTWTGSFFNISAENCKKEIGFACIHQPIKLVSSTNLSHSWSRPLNQSSCYSFSDKRVAWAVANHTCRSFAEGSRLLQATKHVDDYSLFKDFIRSFVTSTKEDQSWWMGLRQNKGSLQWSDSASVPYVDWGAGTDFGMQRSAGVLVLDKYKGEIKWDLKNPSFKTKFICEMPDCIDMRPTLAYIEDRTSESDAVKSYPAALAAFQLHCVMSGWYVSHSISWYKDGISVATNTDADEFGFLVKPEAVHLEDIFLLQGYYWCSVFQAQPFTQIYSSKVLFRFPGLHVFVLYMHSTDLFVNVDDCSDYMDSFILPPEFISHLNQTVNGYESVVLRNLTCESTTIHFYIHIHVQKNVNEEEQTMLKIVEKSIFTSMDTLSILLLEFQIAQDDLFLRSTVACQEEKFEFHNHSTTWPSTGMGGSTHSMELCIGDKGQVVERECLGDFNTGAFWGPVQEECVDVSSASTLTLHTLSKVEVTEDNILNTSLKMDTLVTAAENLSSADIHYVAQILRNIASVPTIQTKVFSSVISTMDQVIGVKNSKIDDANNNSNISSKISFAMESMLPHLETNGQVFKAAGSNIAVSVFPHEGNMARIQTGGILKSWNSNLTSIFNGTDGKELYSAFDSFEAGVLLPENLVANSRIAVKEDVGIVIHRNIHHVAAIEVVSPVIGVSIGSRPVYDVDPPIEMIFKVPKIEEGDSYWCVFWDQKLNNDFGGWSYKGCISRHFDSFHVQCSCDHLTSFAVILEHGSSPKVSDFHQNILSHITLISCALSAFGLGIIILTFVLFRQWRRDLKHKALFHLSLALFLFLVVFMVGVERRGGGWGCVAAAALLHLLLLASFAWMAVEAFVQYLRLVRVVGTYIPGFMQKASLFAWGVPLLIVGIMLTIDYNLYDSKHKYCWVSEKAFYYAVAAPVCSMLALNFGFFTLILYSNTCGRSTKYLRTNQSERKEMITRAKAVFCVSILLGLSWIFGFLAVYEAKVLFQYLFAVTTTLQGFFIFVFFVCCQKNTRSLWLGLITCSATQEASKTGSTGASDVNKPQLDKVGFRARFSHVSFFK